MLHESGTGGAPKYGVVPQMPLTDISPPVNLLDNTTYLQRRVGDDTAKVGYFKTELENGVTIELSGARHSGIMQYSYPADGEKHILVDISHYLPSMKGGNSVQIFVGGEIHLDEDGKKYTGYGTWAAGWNEGAPFRLYYCGEFETAPDEAKTFRGRNTDPMRRYHTFSNEPYQQPTFGNDSETSGQLNDRIGALFSWSNSSSATVKSRVGVSFISAEKACKFKDEEIKTWSLNDTVNAAVEEWNRDVFSKVQVPTDSSRNRTDLVLLYSSLYFMHLMPSDREGENPLWDSGEPSYDDIYTAWDIFRCTTTLYHILQPARYEDMIRSFIDIWRYEGYMPDGRSGNYNGLVQGGSDADNILADAYVRGLRGNVNWTAGYQAMLKNAEVQPYNTFSLTDPSASVKEGRGALNDWISLGYVSSDKSTRGISRTVEYALNDFALAQVAKGLAPGDVQKYMNRSAQWQNIWAHNFTSLNFTGFLAPRLADGTLNLTDYNPALCGECSWKSITYEATPFGASISALASSCELTPSPRILLHHTARHGNSDRLHGRSRSFRIKNRLHLPSEHLPGRPGSQWRRHQHHHEHRQRAGLCHALRVSLPEQTGQICPADSRAGQPVVRPALSISTTFRRRQTDSPSIFHNAPYGVPGNSDAGALNSWLIWQQLGLYPVVTQPIFLLGSPWFDDINMTVNGNHTLRITANGLNNQEESYYVQSVKVNGKQWDKNWVEHDELMLRGGTLEFELGTEPCAWESGEVPPSPGHLVL
jgi:putative alpha-1,2-mannosidase